jgi:hypothetical protein
MPERIPALSSILFGPKNLYRKRLSMMKAINLINIFPKAVFPSFSVSITKLPKTFILASAPNGMAHLPPV